MLVYSERQWWQSVNEDAHTAFIYLTMANIDCTQSNLIYPCLPSAQLAAAARLHAPLCTSIQRQSKKLSEDFIYWELNTHIHFSISFHRRGFKMPKEKPCFPRLHELQSFLFWYIMCHFCTQHQSCDGLIPGGAVVCLYLELVLCPNLFVPVDHNECTFCKLCKPKNLFMGQF